MKKAFIYGAAIAFLCGTGLVAVAGNTGPTEMILQATVDAAKKPKPVKFPHAEHQGRLECGECHHTKGADGSQVAYTEGMEIQKCETCHNKAAGMPKALETFKKAAHKNCKACHKASGRKELAKCGTCHSVK